MTADPHQILQAFTLTLIAGLATGIGGYIGIMRRRPGKNFLAGALGFSAGVMLFVSFGEILPNGLDSLVSQWGERAGTWAAYGAFFAGIAVIAAIDRLVPEEINPHEPATTEGEARQKRMMKAGTMTALALGIHNFPEGFATFVSGLTDLSIALPIVVAIAIHNIPEGIAVAVPIREATGSRKKGFWIATLSGFAEPAGALIGFALLMPFMGDATLGITFAAVSGVMVFICLDELLPTAVKSGSHHSAIYGLIAGMALMAVSLLLFI